MEGPGGSEKHQCHDGRTVGRGDAATQARRCLEIIAAALEGAGASTGQVARTRILLTRIEDWQAVAAVHDEFFREIRPVNTIMQISRLIDLEWLVEIEADAVVDAGGDNLDKNEMLFCAAMGRSAFPRREI